MSRGRQRKGEKWGRVECGRNTRTWGWGGERVRKGEQEWEWMKEEEGTEVGDRP